MTTAPRETGQPAIRAERLAKRYRIGAQRAAYSTLRDSLATGFRDAWLRATKRTPATGSANTIWALQDVSFELAVGDILGVIGTNGSGKTTLLKILARVTRPTAGRAWLRGRVGSLLEVGTGFHPELTGRENVYLSGAVLGMRKSEISRQFDAIVAFAETDRFVDTPVKRYSSGMYMRLAFSVAAHLDTEILLVDEVLAVGDVAFQEKCLRTMQGAAQGGRTVVFVSHNMAAVQGLCRRVLWLSDGRVVEDGTPNTVVAHYLAAHSSQVREQVWGDPSSAPGNDDVRIHRVGARPMAGGTSEITMRTPITLEFEFWNLVEGAALDLNIHLITDRGIVAFESSPSGHPDWTRREFPIGLVRARCQIPGDLLIAGRHVVSMSILRESAIVYHDDSAIAFEVADSPDLRAGYYGEIVGVVRPVLAWTTDVVNPA
jgi:lipopolysaccharide transport system ATP-binding protein